MQVRSMWWTAAVLLLAATAPVAARAELFKCKDANGVTTYRDTPCADSEKRSATDPVLSRSSNTTAAQKVGQTGLWETTIFAQARASHGGAPSAPVKTLECRDKSKIEEFLSGWAVQCEPQIRAQGGACEVSRPVAGARQSTQVLNGDYKTELDLATRVVQGNDEKGRPIVDEGGVHIRYAGPCKADMKIGDTFLVDEDGSLKKQR